MTKAALWDAILDVGYSKDRLVALFREAELEAFERGRADMLRHVLSRLEMRAMALEGKERRAIKDAIEALASQKPETNK